VQNFFCVFFWGSGGVNFCRCERGFCRCERGHCSCEGGHSKLCVPNVVSEKILGLGKNCLGK
jgi:hypothetical protein